MPRCKFTHNGTPTTQPGTEDDDKRIFLSQWITAMLVFNGDEQEGEYQTPGAKGYAAWEIVAGKKRFKPAKPKVPKEKIKHSKPTNGKQVRVRTPRPQ